jgi:hypothetical protein
LFRTLAGVPDGELVETIPDGARISNKRTGRCTARPMIAEHGTVATSTDPCAV